MHNSSLFCATNMSDILILREPPGNPIYSSLGLMLPHLWLNGLSCITFKRKEVKVPLAKFPQPVSLYKMVLPK